MSQAGRVEGLLACLQLPSDSDHFKDDLVNGFNQPFTQDVKDMMKLQET